MDEDRILRGAGLPLLRRNMGALIRALGGLDETRLAA
jgi:hypothetical protein